MYPNGLGSIRSTGLEELNSVFIVDSTLCEHGLMSYFWRLLTWWWVSRSAEIISLIQPVRAENGGEEEWLTCGGGVGCTDSLLGRTVDCRLDLICSKIFSCQSSHSVRLRKLQLMLSIKGPRGMWYTYVNEKCWNKIDCPTLTRDVKTFLFSISIWLWLGDMKPWERKFSLKT